MNSKNYNTEEEKQRYFFKKWRADWNTFVSDVLKANLDKEQQAIIRAVQYEPMVAVASGTARGKDFVAACASLCFMYLTPRWNAKGELVKNTKIALTAPSSRQVENIMTPEVRRLFRNAQFLPGRLVADDIRTDYEEWFLTGFKAADDNTEAWSGFHAVNTMFVVTEASGISENVYAAIEGNLQGNSRLLLVFNPNITTGYAARAMKSERFKKFRLNSLNAENVRKKADIIPGQVNYEWVKDKVETWCTPITKDDFNADMGDFRWERKIYRPNDLFRVKVLGMFPRVQEDVLIPYEWIEQANRRWREMKEDNYVPTGNARIGVDVAGMGCDSSVLCKRYDDYVESFQTHQSGGKADHMHVVGMITKALKTKDDAAFIDTIGEGAPVLSRLNELGHTNCVSCKFSESAKNLHDESGEYEFANMKAYLYWAVRDWLDPKNGHKPALPPDDILAEDCTETHWSLTSTGKIAIEKKDDFRQRVKRSPDKLDSLANTFYPRYGEDVSDDELFEDFL